MKNSPKISIIIPVYNRAIIVPETLNSIISQIFIDWECILVDDHSTDNSLAVLYEFQKKDVRFKVFRRPSSLKKGANSCRNFGFLQARGTCIKWFDSDDIMLPNHLETSYKTLIENNLDFVVTDTLNFNHDTGDFHGKPYDFDKMEAVISAENFALHQTSWITDDFLGTRQIVEKIKFNENITTDGDEYNFFIRLLNQQFKGVFINQILTNRRIHINSLTSLNHEKTENYLYKIANIKFHTANDLVVFNNNKLIRWFLSGYMQYAFDIAMRNGKIPFLLPAFKLICNYYSFIKGIVFLVALGCAKYFNKGYYIMKYARK